MHPRTPLRRLTSGVGALLAIAALLGGIPVLLYTFAGSPIPTTLPTWNELSDTLGSGGVSDTLLVDIVAAVGWLAWLQIAASFLIEVVAWGRGRPAPRVRLAGPAQPAVRKLVAAVAFLLSSPSPAGALPTATVASVAVTALPTPVTAVATITAKVPTPAEAPLSPGSELPAYMVARYDTLWALAEQHLGDPLRWPELYALNQGCPQPNGRMLSDPDLIHPGWTLRFPADAVGLPRNQAAPPSPAAITPVPIPTIAPAPGSDVADPTATSLDTGAATTTIGTTTIPASPSMPAPAPTTTPRPRAPGPSPSVVSGPTPTPGETPETAETSIPWPAVGGGLAAAGLVLLLNRLRRVQQRRRAPGTRPTAQAAELEEIERRLRHVADLDAAERLDVAMRALGAGLASASPTPRVLAVRSGADRVELLVDEQPPHPPKGFTATDHERAWQTDPDLDLADLRALGTGEPTPLPSLVCIGEVDGEALLIDIETAGLLTIEGAGGDGVLRSIITQLATAPWIDHVDVLLVTEASTSDVTGADQVRRVADIDTAVDELRAISRSMTGALTASAFDTTIQARCSDRHDDGWIPTVLVTTEPVTADQQREIASIVGRGLQGVAAVIGSSTPAPWHLKVGDGRSHLAPLGILIEPSTVDPEAAERVDELLTDAAVSDAEGESIQFEEEGELDSAPIGSCADPPFEIEVCVLGPVEIKGIAKPIERRRAEELVAYLALHPKGANDDRIKTVLWRDRAPTTPTFNTTVSFARTALGQSSDGEFHFPRYSASERIYRLGPTVTTDLARLEARIAHARRCPPDMAIETLRSALEMVRGMPFEGTRDYEWAYSEQLVAHAEAAVADAANRLADLYLAEGDHPGATWAARQGLRACPADEALYRALMRARHLAGDPAGVEAAFQELCEAVDALEPYDCLQESTVALRRSTPGP